MPMTIAEQMLLNTCKIEAKRGSNIISTGTGFYWGTPVENEIAISLITNKHVLNNADGFTIYVHVLDPQDETKLLGKFIRLDFERLQEGEIQHPNQEVDLMALNVTHLLNEAYASGHKVCLQTMQRSNIPSAEQWASLDAIEEVIMVGCPRGITDEFNNMPLARRGITATSVKRDFNGHQEFMIDLACFPGSSGSPVYFVNPQPFLIAHNPDGSVRPKPNFALLGILHAGPQVTNEGHIVLNRNPSLIVPSMMHLGQVIRSTRILEIDDLIIAEFAKRRKS